MGNYNPGQPSDQYGFRVIEVKPGSPAEKCGLKVSTDYIVSINEQNLIDLETSQIVSLVNSHENKQLRLEVFSSVSSDIRNVILIPSRSWPGDGLLGVIIRYDRYDADKLEADQNMSFDNIYDKPLDEPTPLSPNNKTPVKPETNTPPPAAPASLSKSFSESFSGAINGISLGSGIPSFYKKKNEKNNESLSQIDADAVSYDNIYGGGFEGGNPLSKKTGTTSTNNSPKPATANAATPKTPIEDKQPKKAVSGLTPPIFSWAGSSKP